MDFRSLRTASRCSGCAISRPVGSSALVVKTAQAGGFLGWQAKSAVDDLSPTDLGQLSRIYGVVPNGRPIELEGLVRLRSAISGSTSDMRFQASNAKMESSDA